IKLKGRMDATWSDHVARALAECVRAGQHTIAVDMAEVDYMSSAGIRILVLYARQLTAIQGRLSVINASSNVRKVLELSGLDALLLGQAGSTTPPTPDAESSAGKVVLEELGAAAEVFELDPGAALHVQWPGSSAAWLEGHAQPEDCASVEFPANVIGLGLGALGSADASNTQPFGEFLAAAGAAVCQPADGSNKPDYLLQQAAFTPSMKVAYGMLGRGGFRHLLRFDKGPNQPSLPLSTVVRACLNALGTDSAGLVMVAETASLIGASLQKPPGCQPAASQAQDIFAFPEIRDWLSFTAEAAFANSTCLVVGFAATKEAEAGLRLLKPLVRSEELYGHFHAAAFPYHPLRKGKVDPLQTIRPLFESEQVLGLLHLLNDWRELSGAGESRFLRGACWCAPLSA
ncbi:MAG: STAS domain-containing protein, partial [Verrucomicrobia bacterium]|nr:STAS domain-containing protein [Verrucomicrobiota bacterium]